MFCGLVFGTCWDLKDALNLPKNHSKKLISLASVARYFNLELIKSFIRSWFFNFVTLVLTSKIEFIDTLVRLWYLTVNNGGLWAGILHCSRRVDTQVTYCLLPEAKVILTPRVQRDIITASEQYFPVGGFIVSSYISAHS